MKDIKCCEVWNEEKNCFEQVHLIDADDRCIRCRKTEKELEKE